MIRVKGKPISRVTTYRLLSRRVWAAAYRLRIFPLWRRLRQLALPGGMVSARAGRKITCAVATLRALEPRKGPAVWRSE